MKNNLSVKNANLAILNQLTDKLDDLCEEVVFLGGCTLALLITDPIIPDVRYTEDVDCIVDVMSLTQYKKIEKSLLEKGFTQSIHESVICRWFFDEMILDVMPTEEAILGFGNRWYKSAIANPQTIQLETGRKIKVITPPYFLATKLEAFHDRGDSDYLASHDLEDIISLIDGRDTIVEEIRNADTVIKNYLATKFSDLLSSQYFQDALPGHLNYGVVLESRLAMVLERMESISQIIREDT